MVATVTSARSWAAGLSPVGRTDGLTRSIISLMCRVATRRTSGACREVFGAECGQGTNLFRHVPDAPWRDRRRAWNANRLVGGRAGDNIGRGRQRTPRTPLPAASANMASRELKWA